ncbi:GAF domain-containing sensor histidine kinase [uncultured Sulfitobacter sp.]|uniref:GAF domain-containing sensor histidine kinase n=1 Tax=uncultured Sulfitobacter sp. TaxID=191468 RepID=UPI0026098603|nr:GAF domain-containing sensor histidine kinase [uncultured Sulfitobacter sp.]
MRTYPIPFNEEARVGAVRAVPGLTPENEPVFDAICRAVATVFDCPIAHISVVEESSQWYKSVVGIDLPEMPKDSSFCTHTIMSEQPMIIPDLSLHPKFCDHPMVVEGGPQARFYAGVPLVLSSGFRFGSLCVLDVKPHSAPTQKEIRILEDLGQSVVAALERAPAQPAADVATVAHTNFLTLVGHELRTPLTVMQGALRLLEARLADPLDQKLAGSAHRATEHLSKLINTILHFSNVTTGEVFLNEAPVDLAAMVRELHEHNVHSVAQHGKDFAPPECDVVVPVLADAEHIRICMTALLLNAIAHGGDAIQTAARHDAHGNVEITVRDNGRLEDHIDLAELYKPFIVGGSLAQRSTDGGLGLGLPLTRKLVELHGGEFEVHAGQDTTTALIRLPRWRTEAIVKH